MGRKGEVGSCATETLLETGGIESDFISDKEHSDTNMHKHVVVLACSPQNDMSQYIHSAKRGL